MALNIKKAVREKVYTKIALMGPSGAGKSFSGLRLATGMAEEIKSITGKKAKILMVNTEASRGLYYADEFEYDIYDMEDDYSPMKYIEVIDAAVEEGYDILIIDSTSPEWEGPGGCLDLQKRAGGTIQAWSKVSPLHNKFLDKISESHIHIIATMRGKDQYEIDRDDKGKQSVKKLGVGARQREGIEYEFTCTFMIDQGTNMATSMKDNTHIFEKEHTMLLTEAHGEKIIKWANNGIVKPIEKKPKKAELPVEPAKDEPVGVDGVIAKITDAFKAKLEDGKSKDALYEVVANVNNGNKSWLAVKDYELANKILEVVENFE